MSSIFGQQNENVWLVPIAVALIAAVPYYLGWRENKRRISFEKDASAVGGFNDLAARLMEDNEVLRAEVAELRHEVARLSQGLAECESKHDEAEREIAELRLEIEGAA